MANRDDDYGAPDTRSTCEVAECHRPVEAAGLCAGHRKRKVRGEVVASNELSSAPRGRQDADPRERLDQAALRMADYDSEGDDAAFRRAADNHRKAAVSYTRALDLAALEAARRRGVRVGRPPAVPLEEVLAALKATGRDVAAAAKALGVSVRTVWRALRRQKRSD